MAYSKEEEFQIIENIRDGDRNRYQDLVDEYASMVFSIVTRFADREEEKKELAQQIFVKAYERLESFKYNSKFSSWLYTLARNHCLDYAKNVRRDNKEFSEMDDRVLEQEMSNQNGSLDDIENREWKELLEQALGTIKPLYAEAFLMKYRENMSYKAMAKRLDASESALKVRVHRARKKLKEYIEENIR